MDAHRHRWTGIDFLFVDDRPMMRQSCTCGASRDVRAFDASWTPAATETPGGFDHASDRWRRAGGHADGLGTRLLGSAPQRLQHRDERDGQHDEHEHPARSALNVT
jgi:hypothetical protein